MLCRVQSTLSILPWNPITSLNAPVFLIAQYSRVKVARRLAWRPSLGFVTIEIALPPPPTASASASATPLTFHVRLT